MPNKRRLKALPVAIIMANRSAFRNLAVEVAKAFTKELPSVVIPTERGDSRGRLLAADVGAQIGVAYNRKIRPDRLNRYQTKRFKGGDSLANEVAIRTARRTKASRLNFF